MKAITVMNLIKARAGCYEATSLATDDVFLLLGIVARLEEENKKAKAAYSEIFEEYIPVAKMDEANDKLILLLEPDKEQMARDLIKGNQK